MKTKIRLLFFLFLGAFPGFAQDQSHTGDTLDYIFMGHIYKHYTAGDKIDPRIVQLDMSEYEGIWLGGDVCSEALLRYSTIQYIDSIFDLSSPTTYWALGNHDARNGNYDWLKEFTARDTYFAHFHKGITAIVMNTNLVPTDCENVDNQYRMIKKVCDTIQQSSHLVLIMHSGIWRGIPNLPPPATYAQSDFIYWNANCDSVNSTFVNAIYPLLKGVKEKGIEIICILGDMGGQHFYMPSVDSIHFMGCGLSESNVDEVLIFNYIQDQGVMNWQFHNLDSLLSVQQHKAVSSSKNQ
ncbi:MAG: hypothetical protein KAT48_07310 [Bacteroidales bacterium]|nr:hypothetical protein [Bacteroidales bacterium]